MKQNNHGFTLVEMVVVLVLISIISATVLGRSISTNQMEFVGQVDKIRNQIRYAQSMAMKRLDVISDDRWGIKCFGGQYWFFNWQGNFGDQNIPVRLPGENADTIALSDLNVNMTAFTLFFNSLGVPHKQNWDIRVEPANPLTVTISAVGDPTQSRNLIITPETGLITIQ